MRIQSHIVAIAIVFCLGVETAHAWGATQEAAATNVIAKTPEAIAADGERYETLLAEMRRQETLTSVSVPGSCARVGELICVKMAVGNIRVGMVSKTEHWSD